MSSRRRSKPRPKGPALLLGLVLALVAAWLGLEEGGTDRLPGGPAGGSQGSLEVQGAEQVAALHAARRSDEIVRVSGRVERVLKDDLEGSRHQRFILRLSPELTLLVAHNIDLAPRVPLDQGDELELQGEYEWNSRGGVLHWTHHDPAGRHPGGWIEHRGQRYE